MPRNIALGCDSQPLEFGDFAERLERRGFDPDDEESLAQVAELLAGLGRNTTFLGDIALAELKNRARQQGDGNGYSPQVIMLHRPRARWFVRANIWPSADESVVRQSGMAPFFYGLPHDHNFSFLTLGYFGPGYWSDYYEYDQAAVTGRIGEKVDLRFVERSALSPGKLMLYRAHRDVHSQLPPDALSVSINIMHIAPHQQWMDQYRFNTGDGSIDGLLSRNPNAILLRLAMMAETDGGIDLAEQFAMAHPSPRMRWSSVEAMIDLAKMPGERIALLERFARSSCRLVREECAQRLQRLETLAD
ncbi:MAG: transposase [Blastomonas sp.]